MEKRLYEAIKYTFEPTEIRELGEALARESQTVIDLRDQKKKMTAEIGGQIKAATERVAELATKINTGCEFRDVECLVLMDTPARGRQTIIRLDTNKPVREEPMAAEDMQGKFGFAEGE